MADQPDLVEQALGNLVKQFAHPMDCLRELVQNAIDAGTPRIEISVDFAPSERGRGVMEIAVADFGQGMDEAIIDTQLTRLFSSAKEGDLGTIGKFGIGFTSIFAIDPDLVRVLTGRHGENWELLFHRDRTFEKRLYDGPVQGTTITLFKRVRTAALPDIVVDARDTLIRWCEHAQTPITFIDRTGGDPDAAPAEDTDDVFAAFDAGPVAETLNRPFELENVDLQVHHLDGEVECVVGFGLLERWGFFSGGLTLLRTDDVSHLGPFAETLGHINFKVRSRHLEHTLTRDNVIQDDAWVHAMEVVSDAARFLRRALEERLEEAVLDGQPVDAWHIHLARDLPFQPLPWDRKLFRDVGGQPRCLAEIAPMGAFGREAWLSGRDPELGQVLWRRGIKVVPHTWQTARLLEASLPGDRVADVADAFVVTRSVPLSTMDDHDRQMFAEASRLLAAATGLSVGLAACEVERGDVFVLEGQGKDGLLRRPANKGLFGVANRAWRRWNGWVFLQRWVVVNRNHDHVTALRDVADPLLAGFALAQAVMVEEGLHPERAFEVLASRGTPYV